MRTQKEIVRLRQRALSNGQVSLYLDIYLNGRRKYEYLRMYLIPEKSKTDKQKNRETLQLAEAIKSKRLVEIQRDEYDLNASSKQDTKFLPYFRRVMDSKNEGTRECWHSLYRHLQTYCHKDTTFRDIDNTWCEGFKKYLETAKQTLRGRKRSDGTKKKVDLTLSKNTAKLYFEKLSSCLNQAIKDGIITSNPARATGAIKNAESERIFLDSEELVKMSQVDFKFSGLRRAFLFSCLTGLRRSDIEKMVWSEVSEVGGYTRITFSQKKTIGLQYLDVSPVAVQFMGERRRPADKVFYDFKYSVNTSVYLRRWAKSVGIDKKLTFHSARHTFAFLMLDGSVDMYTLSKLLGHKNISTTLKYSHILDHKKREAISVLPTLKK